MHLTFPNGGLIKIDINVFLSGKEVIIRPKLLYIWTFTRMVRRNDDKRSESVKETTEYNCIPQMREIQMNINTVHFNNINSTSFDAVCQINKRNIRTAGN